MAESVASFLLSGIDRGERVMIVTTPEHRELLSRRLEMNGVNLRDAMMSNRLVMLDATKTLGAFMRQDEPNPIAFQETVGSQVTRLADGGRVRIYGEMVDVLAGRGLFRAAQQLEELWNGLAARESLSLFCGYASGHFSDPKTAKILGEICAAHEHLHRKADDQLAEFLLEQPAVKSARNTPGSLS